MSFVSVIATPNFVSAMGDGRAIDVDQKITNEQFEKVWYLNPKTILAFTGSTTSIQIFFNNFLNNNLNYPCDTLAEKANEYLHENCWEEQATFIIAGESSNGDLEFSCVSTHEEGILHNKSYIFLAPANVNSDDVNKRFIEIIKSTGCDSLEQVIHAQELINDYVASIDTTVNREHTSAYVKR